MNLNKKIGAFSLLAVAMLAMGCRGGSTGAGEVNAPKFAGTGATIKIGLILPDTESDTAKEVMEYARQYASKRGGQLEILQAKTKDEIDQAISQASGLKCKGIILDASNREFGDSARTQYEFFKLEIVTLGTRLHTVSNGTAKYMDVPFVGQDDETTGVSAAIFAAEELEKRSWNKAETSFIIIADVASKTEQTLAKAAQYAIESNLELPAGSVTITKSTTAGNSKSKALVFSTSASSVNSYVASWVASGKSADNLCAVAIGEELTLKAVNRSANPIYGTLLVSMNKQFEVAFDMMAAGIREDKKISTFPVFQNAEFVLKGESPKPYFSGEATKSPAKP